jgi:hypothetical protein
MKGRKSKKRMSGVRRKRSRSMGAIDTTNILGVVGGALIAGYLNKIVPTTIDSRLLAGGKVALGIALPMFVKGGETKNILSGVGSGMVAVGSVDLLKSFGVLSGTFDLPVINGNLLGAGNVLSGYDLPVINGQEMPMMNGDEFGLGGDEFGLGMNYDDMNDEY